MDDLLVIQKVSEGNEKAFYQLYDKYSGAIYGVILRMCRNEVLAEELLQDTFLKIWNNIDRYDSSKGRFYTWAYRIAKNNTLNALRKQERLIQTEEFSVDKDKRPEEAQIDYTNLNGAVKKLEPHHQKAISLVYFEGYTHREAHKEMGVPLGTFKSYIRQALLALRKNYGHEMPCMLFIIQLLQ